MDLKKIKTSDTMRPKVRNNGTEMFYPGSFWLETRVIIKISTHPCQPINFEVFLCKTKDVLGS